MTKQTKKAQSGWAKKEPLLLKGHKRALRNGWLQITQSPLSTFTTCVTIAMTLLLTTTLLLSLKIFKHIAENLNAGNQVTLYLKSDAQENAIQAFVSELKQNEIINQATYTSADAALKELSQQDEYKNILVGIQDNPLPPVLQITFNTQDKEKIKDLVQGLERNSLVEAVHLNTEWFERIFAILKLGNRVTYILSTLFSIGVIFIVSNTIQEATSKNYQEMTVLELIGATQSYIRRPFLYVGSLLGLGAGLISVLLLTILLSSLKQPLLALLQSYNLAYPDLINLEEFLWVILFSTFLGWFGSWIAFYKYSKLQHN